VRASLIRSGGRWGLLTLVAVGVAGGCAAEENSSPKLLLLEDVQFTVYTSEKIDRKEQACLVSS